MLRNGSKPLHANRIELNFCKTGIHAEITVQLNAGIDPAFANQLMSLKKPRLLPGFEFYNNPGFLFIESLHRLADYGRGNKYDQISGNYFLLVVAEKKSDDRDVLQDW